MFGAADTRADRARGLSGSFTRRQGWLFFPLLLLEGLNHKGVPLVPRDARLGFVQRQVLMSRNVRGGPVMTAFMGGLNYQVEHHLFPSMPRPNLRRIQPTVRAFCAERGIPYTETSLLESYAIVVQHLNQVGVRATDPFRCPLADEYRSAR